MVISGVLVGKFTEEDMINGKDNEEIEKVREQTNFKYIKEKYIEENGKQYLMIWLCNSKKFKI